MRHMRRLVPLAALVAVIVAGAGSPTEAGPTKAFDRAKASGIDVSGIVETVSHRLQPGRAGLVAKDNRYRLELSDEGFALRLRVPTRRQSASAAPRRQLRRHATPSRHRVGLFDQADAFAIHPSRSGRWRARREPRRPAISGQPDGDLDGQERPNRMAGSNATTGIRWADGDGGEDRGRRESGQGRSNVALACRKGAVGRRAASSCEDRQGRSRAAHLVSRRQQRVACRLIGRGPTLAGRLPDQRRLRRHSRLPDGHRGVRAVLRR